MAMSKVRKESFFMSLKNFYRNSLSNLLKFDRNMSLEDKEVAAYHVETKTTTRSIVKLPRMRWTIEKFSELPKWNEIKGPEVLFMRTPMCYVSLKILRSILIIKLYNSTSEDIKIVKSKLVILEGNGSKVSDGIEKSLTIKENDYIILREESFSSLKDDKLIIEIWLKVNNLATKSDSLKSEIESQNKLLNGLKMLYNNPDGSDFTFQIEDELIYAHKTILRFRSEYFKRMFESQMMENTQNTVFITDVSYSTMKKLVEFLYTGNFPMTEEYCKIEKIMNLYVAADKYQVLDLRSVCAKKLILLATPDNILEILQLAERHYDENLKLEALKVVSFSLS